ncbi:Tetratricopeptide repeat-containing protein [Dyella jiangningensis]|uniref:tetratricopeptide repeat-containing sulfotransferase family protein n=1 Tax=Dyella sp. AtDHG13 TaxID=1938897 RepID=UPI00088BC4AC|nr:tetratricopeptide repeat-containing sulfotransferase family protein [Dyella sp. AtDHG13]PXV57357.1 tetratricopeptide repeat protein [Dyella sp. AtDHG13]SDK41473.1 Tetratricopeptide repeat-containing protein [Dyella jiangningensis]
MTAAQAIEAGRADEADRQLERTLAAYPDHPEVLRMKAGIHSLRGQHQEAVRLMQRALAQRPQDPLYHNTLGSLFGSAGDYEGAIRALRRTCELDPRLALAWYNLGVMLTKSVRNEEATEALQRAVKLAPDLVAARALLADLLRTRGDIDAAASEYRQLLAVRPSFGLAWWGLADLRTQRFDDKDIASMQSALRRPDASENDRIAIGFALAKAFDEQGQYAKALDALATANATARRYQAWDAPRFSAGVQSISDAFEPAPAGSKEALGSEVIFIVSLPRSGSTLVEQILASHSSVEGAGELPDLSQVLAEETRRLGGKPIPQWAREATPDDWQRLGQRYLDRTARWRSERPIFTDKLPSNWIYIGAIRAMLPGAHIVAVRRDPLETCFSCYRQPLDGSNGYSRSFEDLASFWRDFDRSVSRSAALHPSFVREHSYEAMVADPETQIRELLDFCGLPFEEGALNFHENQRVVRSPSATQVRQPMRTDTARSQRYGALLDPLRAALGLPAFHA